MGTVCGDQDTRWYEEGCVCMCVCVCVCVCVCACACVCNFVNTNMCSVFMCIHYMSIRCVYNVCYIVCADSDIHGYRVSIITFYHNIQVLLLELCQLLLPWQHQLLSQPHPLHRE